MKPAPLASWTSLDGKKTIEAKFIDFDGKTLELETAEGKRIKIAVENLSDQSVEHAEAAMNGKKTKANTTKE